MSQTQTLFVGRQEELEYFKKFLQQETPWALSIIGMGGSGKTTLLHHLATDITPETPVAFLNFVDEHLRAEPLAILETLSKQLAPFCNTERVDTFAKSIQEGREELLRLNKQLEQALFLSDHSHWRETLANVTEADTRAIREIRLHARARVAEAFYQQIDTYQQGCLILMLDTCEWLCEQPYVETGQWVFNELLPEVHQRLRQQGRLCFAVLASRLPLPLEAIRRKEQVHLNLAMLDRSGVDQYLQQMGMNDPQLREHVYSLTYGHPLSVSIIGKLWEQRGEQLFALAERPALDKEFNERALLEFIQERLDTQLTSPFRELTHYGVLLRKFDLPLMQAVFTELLPDSDALALFHRLVLYPHIEALGNQRYAFHDLLRGIQAIYVRDHESQMWQHYHNRALAYLTRTGLHSSEWYYHALACNEEQVVSEWLQAGQASQREQLDTLLQAAKDETLALTYLSQAKIAHQQGYFFYHEMRIEEALQSYDVALTLYHRIGDPLGEANVLLTRGDVQQFRKEGKDALDSYMQALTLYREAKELLGEANALKAIGDVEFFRDERDAAFQYYEQALDLYQQVRDPLGEANVRKAMGDLRLFRKELQDALASYEQALRIYRQVDNHLGEANVLQAIGDVRQFRGEMQEALDSYEQAQHLYQQVGSKLGEANILQAMGDVKQLHGEQAGAYSYYEQALDLYRQVGDRLGEANVCKAIGDMQQIHGEREQALESYKQAVKLFRQVGDRLGQANVLQAIGDVQQFYNQLEEAEQSYEQALALYRKIDSSIDEANILQSLGDIQTIRNELQPALQHYEQALSLYKKGKNSVGEANVLQSMGHAWRLLDRFDLALNYYEQALTIFRQLEDHLGEANMLQARGDILQLRHDVGALQSYEEALALFKQIGSPIGEANCYLALGQAALEQEEYGKSLALHTQAYQIYQQLHDEYGQARLLYYRSLVFEDKQEIHSAIQDITEALEIAKRLQLPFVTLFQQRYDTLHAMLGE